jgi:SAM-dependent methyltransferase
VVHHVRQLWTPVSPHGREDRLAGGTGEVDGAAELHALHEPLASAGCSIIDKELTSARRQSIASGRVTSSTPSGATFGRFSGFADLYDANRPTPPDGLGPILREYAGATAPDVVDLGSGSGLSSRWAASWAASVTGIEPNDDMRSVALGRQGAPMPERGAQQPARSARQAAEQLVARITYRAGTGHDTGLPDHCADIVIAVQSLHWMEPVSTLAEVDRILRPGGVFAAIDADWPPVSGVTGAEAAWVTLHRRIRVFEARAARNETGDLLRRPVDDDDPALVDDDLGDPHRNRALPGGTRSWSKRAHLDRMAASGHFAFTRELLFQQPTGGGAERFVALMRSQGSYQGLLRLGLNDLDLGVDVFEHDVNASFAAARVRRDLSFSWRARLGVKPSLGGGEPLLG